MSSLQATLSQLLSESEMKESLQKYCNWRGIEYVGEIYTIRFTAWSSKYPKQLKEFCDSLDLPDPSLPVSPRWHPPYMDNAAVQEAWAKPLQQTFSLNYRGYCSKYGRRWEHAFASSKIFYLGEALRWYNRDPESMTEFDTHLRYKTLHSGMVVPDDWSPPENTEHETEKLFDRWAKRLQEQEKREEAQQEKERCESEREERKARLKLAGLMESEDDSELSLQKFIEAAPKELKLARLADQFGFSSLRTALTSIELSKLSDLMDWYDKERSLFEEELESYGFTLSQRQWSQKEPNIIEEAEFLKRVEKVRHLKRFRLA